MSKKGIYSFIKNNGTYPFHMPGHKRSPAFEKLYRLGAWADITEIQGADDLHAPQGLIAQLMKGISNRWGSEKSYILANGSTCGNLAAMGALGKRGDKVLVARNCHRSVYHGLELFGYRPVLLTPTFVKELGVYGALSVGTVSAALKEHGDAAFLVMTSPTYEGVISDVKGISAVCKAAGVALLVDEAHGAHLGLSPYFEGSAVKAGADVTVQSLHKTLPALTPAALLHLGGKSVSLPRLEHYLRVFQTSSPSYPLLTSVELCLEAIEEPLFKRWYDEINKFKWEIRGLKDIKLWEGDCRRDLSKLVLTGKNGKLLGEFLRKRGLETEYATEGFLLAMTGAGDGENGFSALACALREADAALPTYRGLFEEAVFCVSEPELSVEAAMSADTETVAPHLAEGRISAEYIWAYPPGIPLLMPGQRINAELARADLSGAHSDSGNLSLFTVVKQ